MLDKKTLLVGGALTLAAGGYGMNENLPKLDIYKSIVLNLTKECVTDKPFSEIINCVQSKIKK